MYIGKEKNKKEFINSNSEIKDEIKREQRTDREENEQMDIIDSTSVIYKWRAVEHEIQEKDRRWYLIMGLILVAIVLYAIFTDSLVMAVTFILIGVTGYIILNKKPREIVFYITDDGVIADKEIYEFENIKSFWIFYEANGMKVVSLHTKNKFMPYVHIPIGKEDPTKIREVLLEYIEEVKQKPNIIDTFERILGV